MAGSANLIDMQPSLRTLKLELSTALAGLNSHQTQATPTAHPEKWSVQQIVEHLTKTYASTIRVLSDRLERGSPTRRSPTLRQRITQMLVLDAGHFPRGRRSPESVAPSESPVPLSGAELADRLGEQIAELDALATRGEAVFGRRRCATHQVLGPLSMRQWCIFHLLHGRHHIKQIGAIRADRKL